MVNHNKMPRHYAADIIAIKSRVDRQRALSLVPTIWRKLVREHVLNHFALLPFRKRRGLA